MSSAIWIVLGIFIVCNNQQVAQASADGKTVTGWQNIRSDRIARNILSNEYSRWPNGMVVYVLQDKIDNTTKKNVLTAMRNISLETNNCIRFRERTNETEYLWITRSRPIICAAEVGRQRRRSQMFVSAHCSFADILHGFLHVLGFLHEHTRPDRDNYVNINWENIPEGFEHNYRKRGDDDVTVSGLPYDFSSLMHGEEYAYGLRQPVMTPVNPNQKLTKNLRLSDLDIKKILRVYGC
ncbi:astacin-like metalloprotease toxin 2 [Paramacrobiotus metropolitanus]|uniref:astacin-like metalloprotease toxin 2 n=1 Tax=Paramacrobiotus metropolitanus TaxID=2943436 RepID=UPI0024462859|nr:astacin-like metalloprotease toxin 2 [Paramacrobiotus metropolitanus]